MAGASEMECPRRIYEKVEAGGKGTGSNATKIEITAGY
jgi:hypothetical protein